MSVSGLLLLLELLLLLGLQLLLGLELLRLAGVRVARGGSSRGRWGVSRGRERQPLPLRLLVRGRGGSIPLLGPAVAAAVMLLLLLLLLRRLKLLLGVGAGKRLGARTPERGLRRRGRVVEHGGGRGRAGGRGNAADKGAPDGDHLALIFRAFAHSIRSGGGQKR